MTQHYVSSKIVLAWPETRETQEGYAVTYSNGHRSWCPKDQFEKENLALGHIGDLPGYQQRMVAELAQLADKIEKLNLFMVTDTFVALPTLDRTLLQEQVVAMRQYHNVLRERILIIK